MHGGRANHVRERGYVVKGKKKRVRGEKEREEEWAVVLRSVRMNAFPLSGEEALPSLAVTPLVCAGLWSGWGL